MNSVQFKDELLEELKDYTTIVHTSSEEGYEYLKEGVCIEVVLEDKDNIFIDLLDEIVVKQADKTSYFDTFEYGDTYYQNYLEALYYINELLKK